MGVWGPVSANGGGGPTVAGRAFRERPLRLGWRVGSVGELGVGRGWAGPARHCNAGAAAPPVLRRSLLEGICANGLPCPTRPLWIPAFAGMTRVGVCGVFERWRRPSPRPCPGFPLSRERRWGCGGTASADGVGGGGPAVAGRAFRERPLRLGWWVGSVG